MPSLVGSEMCIRDRFTTKIVKCTETANGDSMIATTGTAVGPFSRSRHAVAALRQQRYGRRSHCRSHHEQCGSLLPWIPSSNRLRQSLCYDLSRCPVSSFYPTTTTRLPHARPPFWLTRCIHRQKLPQYRYPCKAAPPENTIGTVTAATYCHRHCHRYPLQ